MVHRSIFNDFSTLHKELDSLFPRFTMNLSPQLDDTVQNGDVRPRINLYSTDTGYLLETALPGVDEQSIDISMTENVLTLTAEQGVKDQADTERQWHRRERSSGKYSRRVELPDDIESSGVQAEYRNGLLRITLPKAEAALPKKISVKVN